MSFNRSHGKEFHVGAPEEDNILVANQDDFPPDLRTMGNPELEVEPTKPEGLHGLEAASTPWLEKVQLRHRADALLILRDQPQAFESYIRLCYLPAQPENILEHFDATFLGSYERLEHWAEDYFDMVGGDESLRKLSEEAAIPEGLLTWNKAAVIESSKRVGVFLQRDGDLFHAFAFNSPEDFPSTVNVEAAGEGQAAAVVPQHREAANRLRAKHPEAFGVYLDIYYPEEVPEDLEEDFDAIFVGSYPSAREWAKESYAVLGWTEAIEEARREMDLIEGAIKIDQDKFLSWAQKQMGFQIFERGDQVHVFNP